MEIKITTSNGVKLNTKGKYCADDINIVVDIPSDSGSGGEPTLEQYLKGELTEYSNSNITNVPSYAFYYNKTLQTISLPNCVSIDSKGFAYAYVTSVHLPNCESVGNEAFSYSKLTSLSLPKAKTLGTKIVYMATSLQKVYLDSVETLGTTVFNYAYVKDIYLGHNDIVALTATNTFLSAQKPIKVHVRPEFANSYANETNWASKIEDGTIQIVGDYTD